MVRFGERGVLRHHLANPHPSCSKGQDELAALAFAQLTPVFNGAGNGGRGKAAPFALLVPPISRYPPTRGAGGAGDDVFEWPGASDGRDEIVPSAM